MFILNVKGWGDREDQYYPVSKGDNIEQLKADSFAHFDMEIDYYITDPKVIVEEDGKQWIAEEVIEEGIVNEGVFA
jgi:hypothetical protein